MWSVGIDSGSSSTKGVLFDGKTIVKSLMVPTGYNPSKTMAQVYEALSGNQAVLTVTTGYGRDLLPLADRRVTEITCHGRGASYLASAVDAVIDIGGQDSKVILIGGDNQVKDFLMNDKCAAGTGRFVEMVMRLLHQDLCDLDTMVTDAKAIKISSMCTVFAESEIISHLANEVDRSSIVKGVIHSICERTAIFAKRLPINGPVFFSGGLAQSKAFRQGLEEALGLTVLTDPLSQYAGAIGAALIGYDQINHTKR